jgi:hypothetical protein
MVKRKAKKVVNNDVPNWVVLVLLVAVIVVSTVSIILFMDAAEDAAPTASLSKGGTAILGISEAPGDGSDPNLVPEEATDGSGEVGIGIVEEPAEE